MNEKELEALNLRMLEFAGFSHYCRPYSYMVDDPWEDSKGRYWNRPPQFPQDLTACFNPEWGIVGKLYGFTSLPDINFCLPYDGEEGFLCTILDDAQHQAKELATAEAETPALALCLAVDKLDKEGK